MALRPAILQARLASSPLLVALAILAAVVVLMLVATAVFGVSPIDRPDFLTADPAGQLPF
jgi:hypothetical protein